jgi:hypothetical protein
MMVVMERMAMLGAEYCWCGVQVHEPQIATNSYSKGSVLASLDADFVVQYSLISSDSL